MIARVALTRPSAYVTLALMVAPGPKAAILSRRAKFVAAALAMAGIAAPELARGTDLDGGTAAALGGSAADASSDFDPDAPPKQASPSDEDRATARALSGEARPLMKEQRYAEAADRLRRAARLVPAPLLFRALAECEEALDHPRAAAAALKDAYAYEADKKKRAALLADIRRLEAVAEARMITVVVITPDGGEVSVLLDDEPTNERRMRLERQRHVLVVTNGSTRREVVVDTDAGSEVTVDASDLAWGPPPGPCLSPPHPCLTIVPAADPKARGCHCDVVGK